MRWLHHVSSQDHSYGFLTYGHGTFSFVRAGKDKFAITNRILWHKEGDGVLAHILCKFKGPWPAATFLMC